MTALLEILKTVKLTLTEWILMLLVIITTVMVIVLKMQKNKIHSLELQLLQNQLKDDAAAQNEKLARAKQRLQQALNALHGAK